MNGKIFRAVFMVIVAGVAVRATPPDWLMAVAKAPLPDFPAGASAVVLCDDEYVVVQEDGEQVIRRRKALRILNVSGTSEARGYMGFIEKEDSISPSGPWVVRNGKEIRPDKPLKWVNASEANSGEVFSEARVMVVDGSDFVIPGDVFGYECTVERSSAFLQLANDWHSSLPVMSSTWGISLPPKWGMESVVCGPEKGKLMHSGSGQRQDWAMPAQPYQPREPGAPLRARWKASVLVTLHPPKSVARTKLPAFGSWAELSKWLYELQAGQCDTSPELENTARKLTADVPGVLERIKALGRYVQELRYVAYDQGVSKGYGYRPRKASEVFAKGWGDCKAKANLLRSMLRTVGIESYLVQACLEDEADIVPEWPSPHQFNHAILAIKVDDSVKAPAVVEVPNVGRMLIFDPTNPYVLVGDLPSDLQGEWVHVVTQNNDQLTTLPELPVETSHALTKKINLVLASDGSVSGNCDLGGAGSSGAHFRREIRRNSLKDLNLKMAESLTAAFAGAKLSDLSTSDDASTGECRIKYRFSASHFAQMMPGGLAVVRLAGLNRDSVPSFSLKERQLPIELPSLFSCDELEMKMPAGFVVDELPDPVKIDSKYGAYESKITVSGGTLLVKRSLRLTKAIIPADEYAAAKKFFTDVSKADHVSAVLRQGE